MSTWSGHISDQETARRASSSALIAQNILGVVSADLSSVAVAQAACAEGEATLNIGDRIYSTQCERGFTVASNLGATFSSSYTTFYDSLPDNFDNQARMIS